MKGDNVMRRGCFAMMGGMDIDQILKKDKGGGDITEALPEDLVGIEFDDMSDDQKVKLKEYEQRKKETMDKLHKAN